MEQFQLLKYSGKRPNNTIQKLKKEIIEYLKQETAKNHYPTKRELQNTFHFRIDGGIEELYDQAGLKYKQTNCQELKNQKAKLLTKVTLDILSKLGLDLIEANDVHSQGVDMIAIDKNNKLVGIELKAHNEHEPIKKRNIEQLLRFLKQGFSKIILITTTSRINANYNNPKIRIIHFDELKTLVDREQLKILDYIRRQSVHISTEEKEAKRQLILEYVRKRDLNKCGRLANDISKNLGLEIYTYFESSADVYLSAGINLPISKLLRFSKEDLNEDRRNFCKQKATNLILEYMRKEIKKGHYPSGIDIKNELGVYHIWKYISMTELYKILDLLPYHNRKTRVERLKNLKV